MINEINQIDEDLNTENNKVTINHTEISKGKTSDIGWWIACIIMGLSNLGGLMLNPIAEIPAVFITLICCPPLIDKLKEKNISFSTKARVWAIVVLFFIMSILTQMTE